MEFDPPVITLHYEVEHLDGAHFATAIIRASTSKRTTQGDSKLSEAAACIDALRKFRLDSFAYSLRPYIDKLIESELERLKNENLN